MRSITLISSTLLVLAFSFAAVADESKPDEASASRDNPGERRRAMFFEQHIRPLLAKHCYECHGEKTQKSGLRVDSRHGLLSGGELGEAIDLQSPDDSLLLSAVRYESLEMPPKKQLDAKQIELLEMWIKMGAPWPGAKEGPARSGPSFTEDERAHWAFQPVRRTSPPELDDDGWSRNPIDRFVLARLRESGLEPAPRAKPEALIRRLFYTVTGLPPSPAEVEAFVRDPGPQAYANLVDQLLERPEYGEKWARHWLDLVRYAESDGYKQDAYRPHAWRYRDYVIRSLNDDKPYDQFVQEQLAGDEIAPHDKDAVIATGYLRHWIYEYNQRDVRTQWDIIINDVTDVTADVFLGLGLGCARCHDHKFDPILRKDYYRIRAFFAPLSPRDELPALGEELAAKRERQLSEWRKATVAIRKELDDLQRPYIEAARKAAADKFPLDIRPMIMAKPEDRTPYEQQLADMAWRQLKTEVEKIDFAKKLKGDKKKRWESLRKQLAEFDKLKPAPLTPSMIAADVGPTAPVNFIPDDPRQRDIGPGFLSILDSSDADIEPLPHSTGRRAVLARWITRPDNPLSTRVIVNRIWQYHFGRGLVETSSDFGTLGKPPTHPRLLDWMTSEFVQNGWRMKSLHRLILNSATFQQSALQPAGEVASKVDPGNRLYWRMNIRRLDAEQIRDAMLAISGELKTQQGGPSVSDGALRRSIYSKVLRNNPDEFLRAFDGPDGFFSTAERNVTTTPTQSLLMINSRWTLDRARAMAKRLMKNESQTDGRIIAAFRHALGRYPSDEELRGAVAFLRQQQATLKEQGTKSPLAAMPAVLDPQPNDLALKLGGDSPLAAMRVAKFRAPKDHFTVEAEFMLRSLYPDATVRTIVSQWDDNHAHPGWALGVTSTKSAYQPRNLIMQLIGEDKDGKVKYEVVASNLRPELNRPYRVKATVRTGKDGERTVQFELLDLSVPGAKPERSLQKHSIAARLPGEIPLVIGGREASRRHRWHGLLDDLRIRDTSGQLKAEWTFDDAASLRNGDSPTFAMAPIGDGAWDGDLEALCDLCHVLLNANETIYLD